MGTRRTPHALVAVAAAVVAMVALACQSKREPPLVIAALPFADQAQQREIFASLTAELAKHLGREVHFVAGASFGQVIDQLTAGSVDVAFLGAVSYLEARRKGTVRAILMCIRQNSADYKGHIIVKADSGLETLADLLGKSIAFADRSSTSGYLAPRRLLEESGLQLDRDLRVEFAGTHPEVVRSVVDGRVDAGATYEGAVERVLAPNERSSLITLATTQPIPNDPVVARSGLSEVEIEALRDAFIKTIKAPAAQTFFERAGIDGFVPALDSDYDSVAKLLGE